MIKTEFVFFLLMSFPLLAGPIAPTQDLVSKSKIINIESLDLPYKVEESDDLQTDNGEIVFTNESETTKVEWESVPFIPMKLPLLGVIADPEY